MAWGKGHNGQLGAGRDLDYCHVPVLVPMDLEPGEKVVEVSAGMNHSAALTSSGRVLVWGKMQSLGRRSVNKLGVIVYEDQMFPRPVLLPSRAVSISCGLFHTSVVTGKLPLAHLTHA